ncbi:MAG: hypothetical protein OEN02_17770 [Gammaproteobacteria bacterium]|nr:hypothetical protein [Gammaproteobacteria bacterium]MDH3534358.1 hypothetical protein [Gammaproteobacteria bacterium]
MDQQEILYGYSSLVISALLFIAIVVTNEAGFRIGRFVQVRTNNEVKALTGSIQASILGLLALLLGFTFSMSMQRYDSRSLALIDEANAIGTAVLRIQLLPEHHRDRASDLLSKYIDKRIAMGQIDLTKSAQRSDYNRQIIEIQNQLWSLAVFATNEDPRPVTTGAFTKSLNDLIDNQGRRSALLQMHVPEVVLILLFLVFISSGGILGYSAGLSGSRMVAPIVLVSLLITLIVFIIIDLDRPKRGLIKVDQGVMIELQGAARN